MGMAASQARFLGLTARKSNTEYEGQQVNQQRTALANKSASLYNKLLSLKVPTPPEVNQYYSTQFSVTVGITTYTLNKMTKEADGTYTAVFSYEDTRDEPYRDQKQLKNVDAVNLEGDNKYIQIGGNQYGLTLSPNTEIFEYMKKIGTADDNTENSFYSYTDTNKVTHYVQEKDMEALANKEVKEVNQYGLSQSTYTKTVNCTGLTPDDWTLDANGNYASMRLVKLTDGIGEFLKVNAEKVNDNTAYDQAMTDYQYKYAQYEKTMEEINSETEIIQQQDKTLELRLKQLDTERNALQTEMDAVKEVLKKNVDSTFTTFKG